MYMQGLHYDLDSLFPERPDFLEEENVCLKDYEYLIHLYPQELRLMMTVVEEYLDRYEYEGSPIFCEYPDAVTIHRMVQDISDIIYGDDADKDRDHITDLIEVLVCQEIYVRRRRHERFVKTRFVF